MTGIEGPARSLLIDLDIDAPPVDWAAAPLWRVIAATRDIPCWGGWIVGPGTLKDPAAFTEQVLVDARERAAELALTRDFERRLGVTAPEPPHQNVSVVICTHRRPAFLPALLEALSKLEPAPHEVVIVDNDPGEDGCEDLVTHHGARYVRESRRGLNHARDTGLRAATGTIVAYTDDDCVPAPTWLAYVDEHFGDLTVDGVSGPAFAYELETPAQLRFELEGGFNRGFLERRFDWMTNAPCNSGVVGAGANMLFRRETLLRLGDVFSPELDAGTATHTGGDMYALYRVLEAGGRIVYDPGTYVFHRHRRDPVALGRTFRGYGTGIVATVWKLLLQRREPEALIAAWWLWGQYRHALAWRLLGLCDPRRLRVAADYLLGGLTGVSSWYRAQADQAKLVAPDPPPSASALAPPIALDGDGKLTASLIIPTVGRGLVLDRCLRSLPAPSDGLEIIVVDDRLDGREPLLATLPAGVQVLRSSGTGAAAARNAGARHARGDLLVFLDDDLVASPGLVSRHLAAHRGSQSAFVIGPSLPRPVPDGWAARAAGLWWHDHFQAIASRKRLAPTDLLSGNVSIRRDRFLELGGFSERFGRLRREDWLFGSVALRAGLEIDFDPQAIAYHEYALTTARRLAAAIEEGRGDALLAHEEPDFVEVLASARSGRDGWPARASASLAGRPRLMTLIVGSLDGLERARLRGAWVFLFHRAQRFAYLYGRRGGARALDPQTAEPSRVARATLDATLSETLSFDGLFAPTIEVVGMDRRLMVRADAGRWTAKEARLAARLVAASGALRRIPPTARPAGLRVALVAPNGGVGSDFQKACEAESLYLCLCPKTSVWDRAGQLSHNAEFDVIWVVMPGVAPGGEVARELHGMSDGDRIAVTLAVPGTVARRELHHRQLDYGRWLTLGDPPAMIGFRPALINRLGVLNRDGETLGGPLAPGLELFERALQAGDVVSQAWLTGLSRQHVRCRPWIGHEWQRQRARASLICSRGREARPVVDWARAVALIVARGAPGRRASRSTLMALGGFAHGSGEALLTELRRPH